MAELAKVLGVPEKIFFSPGWSTVSLINLRHEDAFLENGKPSGLENGTVLSLQPITRRHFHVGFAVGRVFLWF
jgi:hypothetical protein